MAPSVTSCYYCSYAVNSGLYTFRQALLLLRLVLSTTNTEQEVDH